MYLIKTSALVFLLLCCLESGALISESSSSEIDQQIIQADFLKTAERELFYAKMQDLNRVYAQSSPEQRDFIDYLRIFQTVLEGKLNAAQAAYANLFNQTNSPQIKVITKATLANIQAISGEYDKALLSQS